MKLVTRLKNSYKNHKWLWVIFAVGMFFRILLNNAADSFDFYAFVMWARYLTLHRFADVFEFLPDGYTPYPPLYYYVLKLLGQLISFLGLWSNKWMTYFIIRSPVFIADTVILVLVYFFAKKYISKKNAVWAGAFYFLHPVIIYNTSIWGQIDSVVTVLGLASILFFIEKKPYWGLIIYTLGVITKLQILALLPLVLFSSAFTRFKKLVQISILLAVMAVLPFLPIIFSKGMRWTWDYFFTIPNWYAYTSVYAYNIWASVGFMVSDNTKLFGILQYKYIGIFLFWFVALLILRPLFKKENRGPQTILFAAFLLWFDFAFFATRIHSRYLIYSFGFFAPFISQFPLIGTLLSVLMIANLLLPIKEPFLAPLVSFLNQKPTILFFLFFAFMLFLLSFSSYRKLIALYAHKK